jgi:hypothetical protein
MGERRVPVEDEVERALASMRAGFASGSEKLAAGVAQLEEYLGQAPIQESESVRTAVAQIVGAQARLKAKMESLPGRSWDAFKAMVALVKAQQTLLDEVGHLVKEHVLPRQLESLTAEALPAASTPAEPAPPQPAGLYPAQAAAPRPGTRRVQAAPARQARRARRPVRDEDDDPPRSLFALARDWTAGFRGLAAMIVAAVVLSQLPRDARLQDLAARLVATLSAGSETTVQPEVPAAVTDAEPASAARPTEPSPAPKPAVAGREERVPGSPPIASTAAREDRVPPAKPVAAGREERVAPPAKPAKAAREERLPQVAAAKDKQLPMALPARREARLPPAAPAPAAKETASAAADQRGAAAQPGGNEAAGTQAGEAGEKPAAEKPAGEKQQVASHTAADAPAQPPAGEEKFVPVLFTHKDYATVMQAMADLKQQYPGLLIGRKGEIQPLDLGKKGIWHRLVFLPAGSRPEATRLCDQLLAQGYDRCWVKNY